MILKIALTILAAGLSGTLGRMGGSDKYNTKWRDIGCSLVACAVAWLWFGWHWTLIIAFGLQFGALTTYFKKKGQPARWYNWLIVGLAWSVAFLPYIWVQGLWVGLGIRSIILPLAVMGWCVLIGNVVWEEVGRYAILILTIPLLLIKKKEK
jgi:hypothetical protein